MKLSPFFHDLRAAYQAELDDLVTDSEGNDVLRKRLNEKRKEIAFLVQMMDLAPEMVAVVFHRQFRFVQPAVFERLVALPADAVPCWDQLAHAVALEPSAQGVAQTVLREPQGPRFLVVAAALEYLQQHARLAPALADGARDSDVDSEDDADAPEHDDDYSTLSADDALEPQSHRSREEASANWLADVGFERKD